MINQNFCITIQRRFRVSFVNFRLIWYFYVLGIGHMRDRMTYKLKDSDSETVRLFVLKGCYACKIIFSYTRKEAYNYKKYKFVNILYGHAQQNIK